MNCVLIASAVLTLNAVVFGLPVSQPIYQGPQSGGAAPQQIQYQQIPAEYLSQFPQLFAQQQGKSAPPVKESSDNGEPQLTYAQAPAQQVLQSAVDRQVQLAQQQIYQPQQPRYQPQPQQPQQYRVVQLSQPPQQQVRYVAPSPQQLQQAAPRPKLQPQQPSYSFKSQPEEQQREPEDYDPSPSYQFGFDVKDDQYTNYQNRKEQRDGDKISGSYSVVDSDGFIRTVTYTADPKEGFKAEVNRQPTDIVVKIPTPAPQTADSLLRSQQTQQYLQASQPAPRVPHQKQKIVYQYE